MKITAIHSTVVPIASAIRNAYIDFSKMTASVVAVVTDVVRDGKRVIGYGFNSNGRYAQAGLLSERMIPRIMQAEPASLLNDEGTNLDPHRIWALMMANEKPGGHGERSVAVGVIDMAVWDAVAKIEEKPLYRLLADRYNEGGAFDQVFVYAAGGYYYPGKNVEALKDEMRKYLDLGYSVVKLKIGGESIADDLRRIEAVMDVVGSADKVAVDANGRFDLQTAVEYAKALEPYGLFWYEEAGDPLDFALQAELAQHYTHPMATGENLFSMQDARNLIRYGGMLVSFDEAKVARMPGNIKVVKVDDSTVAVVADTWWRAKTALDALPIVWDEGPAAKASTATIAAHLKEGLTSNDAFADINDGDAIKAYAAAPKKVEAVYSVPFVAHATMEPMNAVVRLTPERAEVWVATQNAEASLATLSTSSGLPLAQCEAYPQTLGGGFGRRGGTQDYVRQATLIAKQLPPGTPVKLIWSREEDMTHDFYRPIAQCLLQGGLDEQGNLQSLRIRVSGQSINAFLSPTAIKEGKDRRQLQGLWPEPGDAQIGYTVPNLRTEYAMRNTHVPVGPWRGVNTNQNGIFLECFMEELARAAGKDSLEFRRALMKDHPKHLGILNAVAEKGGWGKPLPAGQYRGIAQFMGYGSYSAAIAEVSMVGGKVKVHRMVLGCNSGHAVSPDQIAAQVEGSVAYGLGAAMFQELNVDKGRIVENNFHNYRIMRMAEMPHVETVIAPTYDFWGGIGEPTICVAAPAVMNAMFAATGKPVRTLPMKNLNLV